MVQGAKNVNSNRKNKKWQIIVVHSNIYTITNIFNRTVVIICKEIDMLKEVPDEVFTNNNG